ncbi:MAG TPA: 5'/3'-nucleotidase SurE [Bacteroidales bacterium]|nr:5'/3'-nucleotidase SurE [Bacteroidales bacterium]
MKKPFILITNDDGIFAPGIRTLISAVSELGEIVVIAPSYPQSGMSHAVTLNEPIRVKQIANNKGIIEYSCNGTPVDCIKIGLSSSILIKKPDIILSGINHGSNASINIIYSGTMAAVLEGAMNSIPSIGFSLDNYSHSIDLSFTLPYIKKIVKKVLYNGLPKDVSLNINFPVIEPSAIKGIKVCRQAKAYWNESFEKRLDPHQEPYYWLTGTFVNNDDGKDTDYWALQNNYISITPVTFDFTAYKYLEIIKNINFNV